MTDTPTSPLIEYETLATYIATKLKHDPKALESIGRIAATIASTGMSIEDASLLAKISPHRLSTLSAEHPEIPLYFKLKRAEYKEKLLKVLNTQATENQDVKIAMFLLATNFTDEYDPATKKDAAKKKAKSDDSDMEKLMERVRKFAPASPVSEKVPDIDEDETPEYSLSDLEGLIKPQ
jgi:hypothetical protein